MSEHTHRHWKFLYQHRRRSIEHTTPQIIAGQVFTVVVSIFAGLALDNVKLSIVALTGAFLLLPGIVDLSSTLAGTLGAKLNHLLEQETNSNGKLILKTLGFTAVLTVCTSTIVGLSGYLVGSFFLDVHLPQMIVLSLLTTCLVAVVAFPVVTGLVLFFRARGWNPDNLVGPIQSSLVDVLAIVFIALVAGWLL